MVEQELAAEAIALLSTAIAEIMEDIHPMAVLTAYTTGEGAEEMRRVGRDIRRLAGAMLVLRTRSGLPPPEPVEI